MKTCPHCKVIDGTPHDLACSTSESGRTAKALLRRAIGHLRCAEGHARKGEWGAMYGAITRANAAEKEAREVAAEAELEAVAVKHA